MIFNNTGLIRLATSPVGYHQQCYYRWHNHLSLY